MMLCNQDAIFDFHLFKKSLIKSKKSKLKQINKQAKNLETMDTQNQFVN